MTRQVEDTAGVAAALLDVLPGSADRGSTEDWMSKLDEITQMTSFDEGDLLIEHHASADHIYFLVDGSVKYRHPIGRNGQAETISHAQAPLMPIGWSGLQFGRYRATVVADTECHLLGLPVVSWRELATEMPALRARLTGFIFRSATRLLREAQGVEAGTPTDVPTSAPALDPVPDLDRDALREMYLNSPCFSALPIACRAWLAENTVLYRADANTRIINEGGMTEGLWLLQEGRAGLEFRVIGEWGERTAVRHAVRNGTLLCWSAMPGQIQSSHQVETTRICTLAFVPGQALEALMDTEPGWVGAIFEQQLWQLRGHLLWTRAQHPKASEDGGICAVIELTEDSAPVLPPGSRLYGVPPMLRSKLTREQGFEELYRTLFNGTSEEQATAELALDLLHDFERGHKFYLDLLSTYRAVVRNRNLEPAQVRKVSTSYFRDALAHVPYAIEGLENLPDDPNCIFIYNHMAYADESILPNGFLFNPDSHLLSSMIMEPKYGDGIRISRTNGPTEHWRANYYDPLGHIPVVTPESGWLKETREEKQRRKDKFFEDCQAVLDRGLPFSIAPEGTITEGDSITERSPGPLKPGAFLMSRRLPSRPMLVPVAFANIDKPAWSATFACVVKPPFSVEDRDIDVNDRKGLARFLEVFRAEFRGYVEEAVDLARRVETPGSDLSGIVTNLDQIEANQEFEFDVRSLELHSRPASAPPETTVFYGSSTFREWDGLADDLDIPDAVNLGFGGATLEDCRQYFERLVIPHNPKRLILYGGENDLAGGAPADVVYDRFRQFATRVEMSLPHTQCWFVSIKPTPALQESLEKVKEANTRIESDIAQRDQWNYVDWYPLMLDRIGQPKSEFFRPDGVHLNKSGYTVLTKLLRRKLPSSAH